eukprot:787290-Pelagomonas_calceolata.AAC.6
MRDAGCLSERANTYPTKWHPLQRTHSPTQTQQQECRLFVRVCHLELNNKACTLDLNLGGEETTQTRASRTLEYGKWWCSELKGQV